MRPKKNRKILIILIILLALLILVTGIVYVYVVGDLFKSNKELFLKYVLQMGDEKEKFIDTQLEEYFEKQKNTPYTNDGTLKLNITSNQETVNTINNFNISFVGKTDTTNNYFAQDISLNYSDEITFPVSYRKTGNILGLQTKYINNKYIAVETGTSESQTYEGLTNVNNVLQAMDKLDKLKQLPFNQEEWQKIQETCINAFNTQLQDSQFSKIEESNSKSYKLTLQGKQLKTIGIQLLETLKNDQIMLDKVNDYIKLQKNSAKLTTNTINNYIKDIEKNSEFDEESYEISIYQEKGKVTKLVLTSKEMEIRLEKKKEENSLQYNISLATIGTEEKKEISFNVNYTGLSSMQNVNESYELQIQTSNSKENYSYQYNNQINFTDTIIREEFTDENAMILTNYEEEQVNNFLNLVEERIKVVNKEQMEKLGLQENENPVIQMITPLLYGMIYQQATEVINSDNNNLTELEINVFNQKFENYESTNLKGVTVKGLLSTIQLNNESEEKDNRKIKEIHFDGQEYEVTDQNIVLLKSTVETETAYRVAFEKDEDTGIIYRAVINKK